MQNTALQHAVDFANSHNRGWQGDGHKLTTELRVALNRIELEEWRKLLMWGLIVDHKARQRIKAMAKDRFLDRNTHIADFLNPSHVHPGQYWSADADHFLTMVNKLFAPEPKEERE